MKDYGVTVTKTMKMTIDVEAQSMEEAIDKVREGLNYGRIIWTTDHIDDIVYDAHDLTPKVEMSYPELSALFRSANEKKLAPIAGYIVFTADSFDRPFNEESRTYCVYSNNKAYQSDMGGYSIFGFCLDGTDPGLRLDGYMRGDNAWKIEKCYMLKDGYDRFIAALEPYAKPPQGRDER